MSRLWRVYHAQLPSATGAVVELERDEAHHVRRVLRLSVGEPVAVFDGQGNEWRARVGRSDPECVTLTLETPVERSAEAPVGLELYQGSCKGDRMDWIVQKATELGVAAIRPFVSRRSGLPLPGEHRLRRWRRIAVEACKQCGRRRVPRIAPSDGLPGPPSTCAAFLLDAGGAPLGSLCRALAPPSAVWIAVGPEAGFEASELQAADESGWQIAGLGPRTLRADTAGIVAAAILMHRLGDLGRTAG